MKGSIAALLIALLSMSGWGCATVNTDLTRTQVTGPGAVSGTVRVAIFDRRAQVERGLPSGRQLSWQLARLEGKDLIRVHESQQSSGSVSDLPPGKYRFTLTSWVDAKGKPQSGDGESFRLAAGETVKIETLLEDRRRNVIITAAAVGGGATVIGMILYLLANMFKGGINLSGSARR